MKAGAMPMPVGMSCNRQKLRKAEEQCKNNRIK
jgi:hypothetical protein